MPLEFKPGSLAANRRVQDADAVVERLLMFRRPYESRWNELYRHLVGKADVRTYPDGSPRANVFASFPYSNVNFVRNTINEALFSMDPPFQTIPGGAADEASAYKMQLVLEKLVLRDARLRHVMNEYVAGLATYGFYAIDVGWDWDLDFVYEMVDQLVPVGSDVPQELIGNNPATGEPLVIDPTSGMPAMQRVKQLTPVPRNRPKYSNLDIFDVAIDPDGAYIAKFFDKTIPQMERESQVAAQAGMELYNAEALARLKEAVFAEGDSEKTRNALVRVCELWNATDNTFTLFSTAEDLTSLSFKDQRYTYRSATYSQLRRNVAQSVPKTLLATGYNPYNHCKVPILYTHYTKLPGETFGMGVIEPSFNSTEMFNTSLSMIMDIWNTGVNPRYAYDTSRDFDLADLRDLNVPSGLVGVYGNPSDVLYPLPTHTPDPGAYSVLPIFQQMIESAANISDSYQRGIGSTTGNKTATGINSVIQQANKGMTNLALQLCEDLIQPLLLMTASNVQQFLTNDVEVRITDSQQPAIPTVRGPVVMISPSELVGSFDFHITGAAYMENRFAMQANARMLLETVTKFAPEWLKPDTAIEEMYKIHRIPYPHKFIRTAEEVEQERMRQMVMAYFQAVAAAQRSEADAAAQEAGEKSGGGKGASGGRKVTGGPQRPMPTVDEVTGVARQFAQRMGGNAIQ